MEIEYKFRALKRIKPGAIKRLDWEPYTLGAHEVHDLQDRLLDTTQHTITGSRHALRVRQDGSTTYLTFKGPGQSEGGRHQREEHQAIIASDAANDPASWPEHIASLVRHLTDNQPLSTIIDVRNKRHTWEIRQAERLVAELALDRGEIRTGKQVEKLHEIEIELKGDGNEDDLNALVKRLQDELPLAAEGRTKLERGLALLKPSTSHDKDDDRSDVPMMPISSLAEAGRAVLHEHYEKLIENEDGVRAGDHEAVHDMRVATRRLRAMLEVLGTKVYEPRVTIRLRKGLKRLAASLGVVRDAEVWIEALDAYAANLSSDERAGLLPLMRALQTRRDKGREKLLADLDAKRTRQFLERVEAFVTTAGAGVREDAMSPAGMPLRVRDAAGSLIWARLEELQSFDPVMPTAPVEVLHELRIAGKHLRYTLELFADALGAEGKAVRDELVAAQDHLGSLHDADVAIPFVDELLADETDTSALRAYRDYLAQSRSTLLAGAGKVWANIGGREFRRNVAACIAAL